ncbi:ty3-gypsy retrotransposon protein [Tanacetum coccineum]|uniref:Ty3-gypsy retrotransposon protein n=1 Tax=Tanacetum coccineum TaxID=301880 RepID=A0ABQ5FDK8_9ASTR
MNRVTDISENLLISFYVSGLKPNLQRELLVAKPTNLGDAFALARVTEARLDDQRVSVVGQATTVASGGGSQRTQSSRVVTTVPQPTGVSQSVKTPLLPTPTSGTSKVTPKPLPIKWISAAERQERLSKGLCFNCDNRWVRGHKCSSKFLLLMADEDVEEEQPPETEHEEALESGDISILNSLVGHGSPRSLQLWGTLGTGPVHILIDNGSTHNFIQPGVVERMKLPVTNTKRFKVYIGSGETLLCENICGQVSIEMQGLCMKVDLYVLPMKGPDIVLGIQWLQQLGKVTHDYSQQTMEFTWLDRDYKLQGDDSLRMKQISLRHMRGLLEADDVYRVYELYSLTSEEQTQSTIAAEGVAVPPEIVQLLTRFESLFQVPTTLPPHRSVDHRIHLYPNTKPVNVRPYHYPHYQKGEMEKLVNEMLSQGIIRVSQSPFSSPVLLVKKKDGSYRFCVDYRALNEVTIKDKFSIPTADEMFDELGGAVIFTKLDLRAGYHQIRVHERDVYKTDFRTHDGHYEFLVMPFGLTNAPSTFQATMNRLFSPYLRKFVIVFFDDILVYSATLTAHLEHLECVFKCLQDHHFYVKQSKCVFGALSLEYLGHIISGQGVEMDPKKIDAVKDWPVPTNQRQVRGFLGLAGYYRRFIKDYATVVAPLTSLLQKHGFQWGEMEQKVFDDLKSRMSSAPILGLPNFDEMFVVETDASDVGIGVVLLQNGRPLSYFSRKLGPRMRIAATYQKELFAIVEAVYKWRQYLLGRRFTIRTDHRSLKELMQQVIQTPLQQKYVRKLMGFDFTIEYKPGVTNQVADALSRMCEEEDNVMAAFMTLSQPLPGLISELRRENQTMDELQQIHQKLDRNEPMEGFRREQGLIVFRDRYYIGSESKLKKLLLSEFHNTPTAGHSGVKKMLVGLSALFYWKGLRKSVEEFIGKCLVCQQTKYSTQAPGGLLQPLPTPSRVWEDVSMDFITGLPVYKGLSVIFVVVDRFTKYAHFGPLPASFNAPRVADVFIDLVVKHHGIPKTIVSDRDPIFVSTFWKQLFAASGTQLNHSTAYHPQTDGQTEVVNRGLEQYLRAMVSDQPQHWVRLLPWAEYSYNTSFHSSIGMTPYQAVYGRVPPAIIPYPLGSSKVAAVEESLVERDALLRQLKHNLLVSKHRMEVQANQKRRDVEFNTGDMVLVKLQPYRQVTLAKRHSNKLAKRYYGPFKALERVGKVAYRLALPDSSKIHSVFHVSLLKPFSGMGQEQVANLPEETQEGQPVEQPLAICDSPNHFAERHTGSACVGAMERKIT